MTHVGSRAGAFATTFALVLCVVLAIAARALAQTTLPNTPAGKALAGWLAAFNGDDTAAYGQFVRRNWPGGIGNLERDRDLRARTGGFDVKRVEAASPTTVTALVQERNSDRFARLVMTVDAAEPHPITDLTLRLAPRPPEFALPHLSLDALVAAAREKLQREAAADRFSGAVLVARDGKAVFAEAYGLADRAHNVRNTPQTRFRIGSMNKMFTAVAILQLVQAGKVKLDAPLGTYLPDYPNKQVAAKVTIAQLLTHTGGTGDIFGPEYWAHRGELRTLDDYVKLYGTRGLEFEPGSRFEYSNYGYVLLGRVIERAGAEDYYAYVRKHVFEPAGMTSTGSEPESLAVAGRSIGYTSDGGPLGPNTDTLPYRGTSAGGGYSTVTDLLRFANALDEHKLLDAHYTQLLTAGKVDAPGGGAYAYGFGDRTINGARCFGHNGGAPGMNGDLEVCRGGRYVVAVLANRDPPAAQILSDFLTNRLPEE